MQSESLTIAQVLNSLRYNEKQAVRALVEYLMLPDASDSVYDILSQTTFMDDLANAMNFSEDTSESSSSISDDDYEKIATSDECNEREGSSESESEDNMSE
ncbi:hypothetical protein VNI00_017105 [Paramarasmius palmivorus]|uniref:Uncharacterized protein n=1 Tax=Paramarasmius palmivorus TaxID=297713 RepID=A0AAW0B705_9AGAR